MNGKIAPKSNVIGVADPIAQKGKAESLAAPTRAAWGAPGVRTASMQPKGVNGNKGDPSGSSASL